VSTKMIGRVGATHGSKQRRTKEEWRALKESEYAGPERQGQAKQWKTQCEATNTMGDRCKQPAGFGTDHIGVGMCKYHGGATPLKHGRYSKYTKGTLTTKFDEFMNDPQLCDLHDEIAGMRAMIASYIEKKETVDDKDVAIMVALIDGVRKLIETKNKVEVGEKLTIDVRGVNFIVQQIIEIINRNVQDARIREKIANDIKAIKVL